MCVRVCVCVGAKEGGRWDIRWEKWSAQTEGGIVSHGGGGKS